MGHIAVESTKDLPPYGTGLAEHLPLQLPGFAEFYTQLTTPHTTGGYRVK